MHPSGDQERDPLTESISGAAIEVHRHLGPGLLESMYETCLALELRGRGVGVERQVAIPVMYKGQPAGEAGALDGQRSTEGTGSCRP